MKEEMLGWLVLFYYDRHTAEESFRKYKKHGLPVLLIQIPTGYVVCVYGKDSKLMEIYTKENIPISDDSYCGLVRVLECLQMGVLLRFANFSSQRLGDLMQEIMRMHDVMVQW